MHRWVDKYDLSKAPSIPTAETIRLWQKYNLEDGELVNGSNLLSATWIDMLVLS